jgi:hypothetical protein
MSPMADTYRMGITAAPASSIFAASSNSALTPTRAIARIVVSEVSAVDGAEVAEGRAVLRDVGDTDGHVDEVFRGSGVCAQARIG